MYCYWNLIQENQVELDFLLDHVLSTGKKYWKCWIEIVCELSPLSRRQSKLAQPLDRVWGLLIRRQTGGAQGLHPPPLISCLTQHPRPTGPAKGQCQLDPGLGNKKQFNVNKGPEENGRGTTDFICILDEIQNISDFSLEICVKHGQHVSSLCFSFLFFFFLSFFGRESIAFFDQVLTGIHGQKVVKNDNSSFSPLCIIVSSLLTVSFIQFVLKEVWDVLNHPGSSSIAGERGTSLLNLNPYLPEHPVNPRNYRIRGEAVLWGWTVWRVIPSTASVVWQLRKMMDGVAERANWAAISVNGFCEWTFIIWAQVGINSHSFVYGPKQLKVQIYLQNPKF